MKMFDRNTLMLAVIVSAGIYFCFIWNPAVDAFENKSAEGVVLTKTPAQIVMMLGKPTVEGLPPDPTFTSQGPSGHYCRIEFDRGIAVKTERWTR